VVAAALTRRTATHRLCAALLQKPAWLFLDEATSALDELRRKTLQAAEERLPDTTIISIGHRPALFGFHSRRLELREDATAPGRWCNLDLRSTN
jgi:putative ATP-binding cassette transporter